MLVLDNSLGTEQSTDRIQAKSFGEDDRIGLIAATAPAHSLLALTGDWKKVANALQRALLDAAPRLRARINAVDAKLIAVQVSRSSVDPIRSQKTAIPPMGGPILINPIQSAEILAELAESSGGRI